MENSRSVLARAFTILESFTSEKPVLTLSQIAHLADLPISTCSRFLETLARLGAVDQEEPHKYTVGVHLMDIAHLAMPLLTLRESAATFMDEISSLTKRHIQLARLDQGGAMIVDRRGRT